MQKPVFIAGPCVLESAGAALEAASMLGRVFGRHGCEWVFKGSCLKDNRTSGSSFRGPGMEAGLEILAEVRRTAGVPVTTDIHETRHAEMAAGVVDLLQIPAFLCRQTSLLEAAGATGLPVNVKKGQFMAPSNMAGAVGKLRSTGCPEVWLTERGTFFGYGDLVVDMRSLSVMADLADRVVMDVTHSLQRPGALGSSTGGTRDHAVRLARAASAWGVDCVFFEAHPDPRESPSDGDTILDEALSATLVEAVLRHREQ